MSATKLPDIYTIPLPTDEAERVVFCFAYGDHFNGDNHYEALRAARFTVMYTKGMGSTQSMGLALDGASTDWPKL